MSIAGQVVGLDPEQVPGAFLTVLPAEATGDAYAHDEWKPTTFDATTSGVDGRFQTERLVPGDYTVVAAAFIPVPRGGPFHAGRRLPDFVGVARVTVPEQGPPPPVRIEMKPLPAPPPAKP